MSELHIACAADARYVGHSAAMLHSVLTAGGEEIVVHYLHGADIPSDVPPKLDEMFARHGARIEFHEIRDARLARLPVLDSFGAAMWYRIALPELLPQVATIL